MRFRNVNHALRWYCREAPRARSIPSVDGAHLVRTALLNGSGDVVEEYYVAAPRVDGGRGSVIESRLCDVADIEVCLPRSYEDRLLLCARTIYSADRTVEVMREITGQVWHLVRLYARFPLLLRATAYRMADRGLIPPPNAP